MGNAGTDQHAVDRTADLRWWRAANYLAVAQIYLSENVLLREPLRPEHIKPRLLGHWGTCPGLSMLYAVLNRHIRETGEDWMYVTGPGHGGPALVAATYLEGTYSQMYPEVSRDADGLRRLCRRFSTPGGIPSHVSVPTPGSIHEGGELGYALVHAAGAAFDHPDLTVACVVGDGEAETGPLAGSWKLPAFLDARRDGAVLPVLHLNGAKIAGPTVLARSTDAEVTEYLHGQGWDVTIVAGDDPATVMDDLAAAVASASRRIGEARRSARSGDRARPRWPVIVLRTPKGWTGPREVDGTRVEGTHRAHQVPLPGVRENPDHLRQLEEWLRSYRPEDLFDDDGTLVDDLVALAPDGDKRMGATPYANGGRILRDLDLPDIGDHALDVPRPAGVTHPTTAVLGEMLREVYRRNTSGDGGGTFRLFCPDETASNRLQAVFEVTDRCWQLPVDPEADDNLAPDGRVMEVLSEHLCQGWLEGYLLSGRHGMFATYEAFEMVSVSMLVQHCKWLQHARDVDWRAPVASLNVLLTSTCWRNDHNGFSHQGPGLIDAVIPLSPEVVRVWLPPDANTLLAVSDHCLRSRDHVNVLVVDKQPHLQYLGLEAARRHAADGMSVWDWAGTEHGAHAVDVVLACAGDVPTEETLAAAQLLRQHCPLLSTRVVNIVDLMALIPRSAHPHGVAESRFVELFTTATDVVMAFHGYPRAVHELLHGRTRADRFHVRGFSEQGTTTTPFDMVVVNEMSRYHLVLEALARAGRVVPGADELADHCRSQLTRHHAYVREHFEDMPEIRDWVWDLGR
ncbi:MAG: phosphoketolase family protein [Gordonia paraffinivorans]